MTDLPSYWIERAPLQYARLNSASIACNSAMSAMSRASVSHKAAMFDGTAAIVQANFGLRAINFETSAAFGADFVGTRLL